MSDLLGGYLHLENIRLDTHGLFAHKSHIGLKELAQLDDESDLARLSLHTRPVVRIELLVQGEDGGDAADVVGEVLGFVAREGAA